MAGWIRRDVGAGGGNLSMQMEAYMGLLASATVGRRTGGISSEMAGQLKRSIASADCDGRDLMEFLDRITEDADDEDEHLGPLHDAAREGKMDTCKHLVENLGFDVDARANDGSGKTPLACSVSCNKVVAVRYLLRKGADINKQDVMGFAPLHYAAKRGYDGMARLLLSRGANVDMNSSKGTPLHVAAAHRWFRVMQVLLEHHADPDRVSPDLCTPLAQVLCAAFEKVGEPTCLKCMKLLVKAGADLNSTHPDTPLVIATFKGLSSCVDYLLEVGADANIPVNDALALDRFDATLYSNRSLCNLNIGEAQKALLDAESCINIRPKWVKGYYRKGAALMSLKEYKKAMDACLAGLKLDPSNAEVEKLMREALKAAKGRQ